MAIGIGDSNLENYLLGDKSLGDYKDKSLGYYENGNILYNNNVLHTLETYGARDVVGCCIHRTKNIAFFTKNGKKLGTEINIQDMGQGELYPAFTVYGYETKTGAAVTVNFGQYPFTFNIHEYVDVLRHNSRLS
jgi:SPRY domain